MRILSTNMLRGAYAQETGVCPVFLVTITHPGITVPIRLSSDPTQRVAETVEDVIYGTKSRGEDYIFFPFTLTLPTDEETGEQSISLEFCNVTQKYTEILASIAGLEPPTVSTEVVLAETPDVVETSFPGFLLNETDESASTISATLALETLYQEPYPAGKFVPSYFKGLFA